MAGFDQERLTAYLDAIAAAQDVEGVRSNVMGAVGVLGIKHAYFLAPLTADPRVGRILTNVGLSTVWERHYRKRLHKCDPLPTISQEMLGAFFWPDDLAKAPLDKRQARYLSIVKQYGMERGIGVACHGPHGRAGFFGCAWEKPERPDPSILLNVYLVGQYSFQKYCAMVPLSSEVTKLSDRELEVLSWMCEGKSNPVIAQLIGISRSSVDVYVRRIFAKLGVADRTTACVRAYSLGLAVSGDYQTWMKEAQARQDISQISGTSDIL